ncbi:protein of unknown function (DUF4440) [Abditibacterium utsteinense]|uniref:DUF4440 domain-containing protein n=1 Tax=Abditibacterium utsteinense TaxID=1960156 RepID=A0A2S8SR04_9BACT|nr:nuclear transport factor 2 family protein [Abditibacterium utsteinense]PQV63179.1 protein of unknown function (DUF4440) [Abditibacterium utsteinense]
MKKVFLVLSTAVVTSGFAMAHSQNLSFEKQVRQANQEFLRASIALDIAALDRVIADDAIFSDGGAQTQSKVQMLAEIPRMSRSIQKFSNVNIFRATIHGDTAIVVGRQWRASGTPGGQRFIFTNTFVKRNAGWQIIEATSAIENP